MWTAAFWGLIQGLTEFLPISSSGHLVLVPAVLGMEGPDLATSAVLHLGTLVAVLVYFHREVWSVIRWTEEGRRLAGLLVIGTIPAVVLGLLTEPALADFNDRPPAVAVALAITGVGLMLTGRLVAGTRRVGDVGRTDAALIGLAQAVALVPGVSRSGVTIAGAMGRGLDRVQAARFSFLLGIPAIAGAGGLEFVRLLADGGGVPAATWLGMAVAGVSGYVAIVVLLRLVGRVGLVPFGAYCAAAGVAAWFLV